MKRNPQRGDNRDDLELKKFKFDPDTNESFVNIDDTRIVDALNGAVDTYSSIINAALDANTELEIDCGVNVKSILLRSRTGKTLKLAYSIGNTATEYITVKRGTVFTDASFYLSLKIYLLSEAADTVELLIQRNP